MKLTTLLIIVSILQVSATTFAQKITLSKKNAALTEVFTEIQQQTGYDFVFNASTLKDAQKVTIQVKNTELAEVLDRIFQDQPLQFTIENKMVVVSKKGPGLLDNLIARFQSIDVRGRVVDEKGEPLAGASISVKGGKSTSSNSNGEFYLAGVDEKATLIISFIGYVSKEVSAKAELGEIRLELADSKLKEVQIIAYGEVEKRFSTSNAVTIGSDVISKQPVSNLQLALSGRIPGVFVRQNSGVTSSPVGVTVQGQNSLRNGNLPFYVIDGVPYSPQFTTSSLMGGSISGQGGNALNFINNADIESITVLKDADATAIYGSRAANGAILITTKSGKSGKAKVDLNLQNGWGKVTRKLDMMNTQQYLELRKEAYINADLLIPDALTPLSSSNFDLLLWDQNKNTDWQQELIGGTAQFTSLQASMSGGSATTQFLAGYGYNRESTVYAGNTSDTKGNVHFNITHKSADSRFNFLLSGTYLQDKNKLNSNDLMGAAIILAPNAPDLYTSTGAINWYPVPGTTTSSFTQNPAVMIKQPFSAETNNLITSNYLSYQILPGLQLKSSLGFNRLDSKEIQVTPLSTLRPEQAGRIRSARYLNKSIVSWIIEPQLTYNKNTIVGNFDLLIGSTFQQSKSDMLQQTGTGHNNDLKLEDIGSSASVVNNGVIYALYKYTAIFGRLNYRLKDKYILNLTARRDGSSRFGAENRFNGFYSVGGAWLFTEEPMIKSNWLSTGKLRINYGTTGNDQITDYRYQSNFAPYADATIPYQGTAGLYPTNIANPQLQWEETRKLNLGLDLGILKDAVTLSANYFKNRSSNQLIRYPLPFITGFSNIDQNLPAKVQNTGFEFQLDANPLRSSRVKWYTSLNLTIPRNKLLEFPNLEKSTFADLFAIGQSINLQKAYPYAGVNSQTGLYEFVNTNGELTSSPDYSTDRTLFIDLNPKFYGGFVNSINYKGFEFSFLLQFVKQKGTLYRFGNSPGYEQANQPTYMVNRWRKPGDVVDIQKVSLGGDADDSYNAAFDSNAAFADASFIRLKNASISYSLPENLSRSFFSSYTKLYVQAQNLLTITKFVGTDPETQASNKIPPLRMITVGIQVTF